MRRSAAFPGFARGANLTADEQQQAILIGRGHMTETVGLIGTGAMGSALLKRINLAGRTAQAYDINADALAAAVKDGAKGAKSPAEAVAGVEIVHVFVRTDEEVADVMTRPDGILAGAESGALVLLHSTIMPATTKRIAALAAEQGVAAIDAPVTAIPRMVAAGDAVFLLGGDDASVARAKPALEPLGKAVWHFGPIGSGNVAKIAKNFINGAERVVLAETLNMVEAGGVDLSTFLEMAVAEDGGSTLSRWDRAFELVGNHAKPRPASNLMNKDVGLAARLAEVEGIASPLAHIAADTAAVWVAGWNAEKEG
jgi:3-hydroxyisobutyrate dehydrogenase